MVPVFGLEPEAETNDALLAGQNLFEETGPVSRLRISRSQAQGRKCREPLPGTGLLVMICARLGFLREQQIRLDHRAMDDTAREIRARAARIASTFSIPERILHAFSKDPAQVFRPPNYVQPSGQWTIANALDELRSAFPDFDEIIRGQRVLDYGCGDGFQSVAMASIAGEVMGVDIEIDRLKHGRQMAGTYENVKFDSTPEGVFDVAISLNSFEHFPNPEVNLAELCRSIRPGGRVLIAFGPPWLAPWGAHMNFFTYVPWVNVLFSEKTVFNVRQLYRDDAARSYLPGINKMTISRFESLIHGCGLQIERLSYHAVKGIPGISKIPCLREFVINQVTCKLRRVI